MKSRLVVLGLLGLLGLHPRPAGAESESRLGKSGGALAERRAAEAFGAYNSGDYVHAIALYLSAFDAAPAGPILYNIALIYDRKVRDRKQAVTFYRRYLAQPDADPKMVAKATRRLEELLATPRTTASPPGAIGDAEMSSGQTNWRTAGVVVGAGGLAALGVGGFFAWQAMSDLNRAKAVCKGSECTSQAGVDATNAARQSATFTNVAVAAGASLLLAGVLLYLHVPDAPREFGALASLQLEVAPSPSTVSMGVSGKW